jgi:hypothetical protein
MKEKKLRAEMNCHGIQIFQSCLPWLILYRPFGAMSSFFRAASKCDEGWGNELPIVNLPQVNWQSAIGNRQSD